MSESIRFLWANKLHHMRERVLLHSLITRCRYRGLRSSLCVRRFKTPQCISCCRMIWWSTYGGFEATPTSFYLICLKTCQIICLFYWTKTFICKNKPNVGKLYQICQTVTFICKNKPKMLISGRLRREPAESSVLYTPMFRPIRRYLSPDLAVESVNGWRCSKHCMKWD
jgi:hypothetical protein